MQFLYLSEVSQVLCRLSYLVKAVPLDQDECFVFVYLGGVLVPHALSLLVFLDFDLFRES